MGHQFSKNAHPIVADLGKIRQGGGISIQTLENEITAIKQARGEWFITCRSKTENETKGTVFSKDQLIKIIDEIKNKIISFRVCVNPL